MRFTPNQHGYYQLRWQGDVMIVNYSETWNEITVRKLHQEARQSWEARGLRSWGFLSDASEWTGATPQAIEEWWLFFEDGVQHGMRAFTGILSNELQALLLNRLTEKARALVPYQQSENIDQALNWLNQQGILDRPFEES
ncbi:hypothetical protein [Undibacterium fentianense]|uniref:Uncharacterized protein n=1 Tax=Undibacterium fentianense TaxID=2828728 RepID=A0A941E1Q8_9BURK|nr:hypothetical protein [Undibacterium fentianense]MBR7800785.1 hypothetical protein [Undibacterium fentianense]